MMPGDGWVRGEGVRGFAVVRRVLDSSRIGASFLVVLWLVLLTLPFALAPYQLTVFNQFTLLATIGVSFLVIAGLAGELSIAQGTFFGIGGYTSVALFSHLGLSPWFGLIIGAVVAASISLIFGGIVLSLGFRGLYFAVASLGLGLAALVIANHLSWTNGGVGILVPGTPSAENMVFSEPAIYGLLGAGVLGISTLVAILLGRSRIGLKLRILRHNETLAESMGIRPVPAKLVAFAISAAMAAIAGSIYAQYNLSITPTSMFDLNRDFQVILAVLVGGIATPLGPIVGTAVAVGITELVAQYATAIVGVSSVVYAIVILVIVILRPDGICAPLRGITRLWQLPLVRHTVQRRDGAGEGPVLDQPDTSVGGSNTRDQRPATAESATADGGARRSVAKEAE